MRFDGICLFVDCLYFGVDVLCRLDCQAAEIERRIEQETKAEKHIQKLLLLGIGAWIALILVLNVRFFNLLSAFIDIY